MSCTAVASAVPPPPESPNDPTLDESPKNPSLEALGEGLELGFPPMGCAGKFVGLESSHGFPPAAVDLDPDSEELPGSVEARLDKRRDAGHALDDFKIGESRRRTWQRVP